ncbi:MAG: DUF3786 domain-containing protein [Oscillospiraceae bacterium]|nr:DUF3786 domain-containing protein [Oscillospiraceae bacterium]
MSFNIPVPRTGTGEREITNAEIAYHSVIRPMLRKLDGEREVAFLGRRFRVTGEDVEQLSGKPAHINCKGVLVWYFTFGGEGEPSFEFASLQSFSHGIFRGAAWEPYTGASLSEFRGTAAALGAGFLRRERYGEAWLLFALPKVPVLLTYSEADEEFPAVLDIKFGKNADTFLPFETLAVLHGLIKREFGAWGARPRPALQG